MCADIKELAEVAKGVVVFISTGLQCVDVKSGCGPGSSGEGRQEPTTEADRHHGDTQRNSSESECVRDQPSVFNSATPNTIAILTTHSSK